MVSDPSTFGTVPCASCKWRVPEFTASRFANEHTTPKREIILCRVCDPRSYGGFGKGKPGADDDRFPPSPAGFLDAMNRLFGIVNT